jgi:hypothetical protein
LTPRSQKQAKIDTSGLEGLKHNFYAFVFAE